MITSAVISLGALIAAIVEVAVYGSFLIFELWLFFALFGGLTALSLIAFLSSDKMKEMKAQAQVRAQERAAAQAAAAAAQQAAAAAAAQQAAAAAAQVQLIECPNCKGPVPIKTQSSARIAERLTRQCNISKHLLHHHRHRLQQRHRLRRQHRKHRHRLRQRPPEAPPQAPPAPPAPPAAPQAPPEAPATKSCAACGAQIPASAVFCGQCGAKQ